MKIHLIECAICEGKHDAMREHCPYCGARRVFIGSHSFQPYRVVVSARNGECLSREVVRAFQTNIAFSVVSE